MNNALLMVLSCLRQISASYGPGIWLRSVGLGFLLVAALSASPQPTYAQNLTQDEPLRLERGSSATLFLDNLSRFSVDDESVVEAQRLNQKSLRVRAVGPGRTFLYIWTIGSTPRRYDVSVGDGEGAAPSAERAVPARPPSLAAPAATRAAPASQQLELFVGSISTSRVGEVTRIIVGNDAIAEASVLEDGALLILGKAPGLTELAVTTASSGTRDYRVRVYPALPDDAHNLLRAALAPFPDVSIEPKLGRLIVTGTVNAADFERYGEILGSFPGVLSSVTPQLNIDIEHSVVLDVAVLEVNRNYQRTLGIRWQDTAAGPAVGVVGNLIPNSQLGVVSDAGGVTGDLQELLGAVGSGRRRLSGYLGITSIFGSELQLLQEEGLARILAAPSLSTVSGEEATFLAGGDFPVAILNEFGQPVIQFRQFGVQLEILPFVDRNLNIRSEIRAEVSSVDFSIQVNGVPGLLRRETTSTITARPGQTIVLSGLLDARDTRSVDKIPGLGSIPILGRLFRSDDFIKQRTELIITVTPRIQQPNQPLSPTLQAADQYLREQVLTGSKGIDRALIGLPGTVTDAGPVTHTDDPGGTAP